jgi:predicted dehydrogenase
VVSREPGIDVVGWVDADEAALAALRAESGVAESRCFASLDDALQTTVADAVLVTASLPGHIPAILAALDAGLHVLTEKPFAPSVAEGDEAVERARAAGRILMVSQNYRFFPAPQAVRELYRARELGEPGVIHVDFRRNHLHHTSSLEWHYTLPDPLLVDMSIHHFDLMRMVTGEDAVAVRCTPWNQPYSLYRDPPSAELTVRMASGLLVTYRGSWNSSGPATPWAGEWRMEFEKGEVRWASRAGHTGRNDWVHVLRQDGSVHGRGPRRPRYRRRALPRLAAVGRAGSLRAFIEAVRSGEEPETSGRDNLGSLALTHAAVEASRQDGWVSVSGTRTPSA